jgi:hypothetical protein
MPHHTRSSHMTSKAAWPSLPCAVASAAPSPALAQDGAAIASTTADEDAARETVAGIERLAEGEAYHASVDSFEEDGRWSRHPRRLRPRRHPRQQRRIASRGQSVADTDPQRWSASCAPRLRPLPFEAGCPHARTAARRHHHHLERRGDSSRGTARPTTWARPRPRRSPSRSSEERKAQHPRQHRRPRPRRDRDG